MAEPTTTAPVSSGDNGGSFLKRELNGATFLTLEHIGHMVLVLVVTGLISTAILTGLSLWTGASGPASMLMANSNPMMSMMGEAGMKIMESTVAVGIVAALVVLLPMLVVLDRRTRAEWLKRPGFASRVAYKAPVYTTLGLLVATKVTLVIQLLSIVLSSLALIGVQNVDFGSMYLHDFLPTFITTLVVTGAAWYVFKLAKGKDLGKMFSMVTAFLGTVLAVALFITAVVTFHQKPETTAPSNVPSGNGGGGIMNESPNSGSGGSSAPSFNLDDYKDLYEY
jgi:hypothetical protein